MDRSLRIGSRLPARDRRLEEELLAVVDRIAPIPAGYPFVDHVARRLDLGDRLHGNAFVGRSVDELIGEAVEECEDIVAWSLLAFTNAVRSGADESTLDELRQHVIAASVKAASAHHDLRAAVTAWKRARP